jgi:type II secretion system protein N
MEKQKKKWIFIYILYGFIAFLFFIYALFPRTIVKDYIIAEVSAKLPSSRLSIETLSLIPVAGVSLNNLSFRSQKTPGAVLDIEKLTVKLALFHLFKNRTLLKIEAQGYQGNATGTIHYGQFLSTRGPATAEMGFESIYIDRCLFLQELLGRRLTGKLKGGLSFKGNYAQWTAGTGKIHFTLINGTYPLFEPLAGMDKMDYKKIEGYVELQDGMLKITRLEVTGRGFLCSLKGDILLAKGDIGQSRLDLAGGIVAPGTGNRKIPFTISGSLSNARATLI